MESVGRIIRTIHYRTIVLLVIAAALVYGVIAALSNPSVSDPILDFLLAGFVPGKETALEPGTMMALMLGLAALTVAIAVTVWLVRRVSLHRAVRRLLATAEATNVLPATVAQQPTRPAQPMQVTKHEQLIFTRKPKLATVVHPEATSRAMPFAPAAYNLTQAIRARLSSVMAVVLASLVWCVLSLCALLAGVLTVVGTVGKAVYRLTIQLAVVTIMLAEYLVKQLVRGSRAAWIYIRPHAARFDSWLEIRYRAIAKSVGQSLGRHEVYQVAATAVRTSKQHARQLFKQLRP